ncbi:MAG TPA: hypothetical protein VK541_00120 [Pedobacter sp.]|uniref:lipopolysaccharide biosynthesis protein n=1 Tax=Pedobacter sp. TaxID=1411316 RepID=UPI002C6CD5F0|nr:lipopolysaccharide biosynthesis protein [Pedobacter sp.]HMI00848.1 hypothetical protein [Pedobacter sp.]
MNDANQKLKHNTSEISLREIVLNIKCYLDHILSKWLIISGIGVLGGILGFTYSLFKKLSYTATSTFVLEDGEAGGGLSQYAGLASIVGIDLGGGGGLFQGDNILELYKSRTMIEKTLLSPVEGDTSLFLIDLYINLNGMREKWGESPELRNVNFHLNAGQHFSRLQDSIIGRAAEDISRSYLLVTKPDKKLSILKVDVKSKNEVFSKRFNDQIVKNVNDFYIKTKMKKALQNLSIVQEKTDSVRREMNVAIRVSASVADATPNLNPTRQIQRVVPIQRSQFNAEANKVILTELLKNLELSKISLLKETPLIQIIDQPIFPLPNDRLGKIKGTVVGAFIAGILAVVLLLIRRIFSNL